MERPRTPPMNTFSGFSQQPQEAVRRVLQAAPQIVAGQVGETNLDYIRQQGNGTISNLFGRLNLSNDQSNRPRVNRQQRVMSRRRNTKFWKFTRSGKRKSISRGSFLRRFRKSRKTRKSRKSRKSRKTRKSRKSRKSRKVKFTRKNKRSYSTNRYCKHRVHKNIRTPKKDQPCPQGWETKYRN